MSYNIDILLLKNHGCSFQEISSILQLDDDEYIKNIYDNESLEIIEY
jgi:hypothetical protein